MRKPARPGMLLVATRELRWMVRDRVALFFVVCVPIFAFAFLSLTFSNVVVRNLRVTIVDADHSSTSLIYVQAIASAPGVSVAERSSDLTSAMHAIRSGDAIAAVYIPQNFERDLIDEKRPQIVILTNSQFLTSGNDASSAISSALAAATASLPRPPTPQAAFSAGPMVVEQYVLTNPALNYAQFLLRAVLPHVLHVIVAVAATYAVGTEFSRRRRRAWLRAAGGSVLAALFGKLAPYFAIFIIMMTLDAGVIHGVFQVPFRGNAVFTGAAACLLIIAYLALGSFFSLLTRNLATGLSLTAIFCNPAFGFAGVGFPLIGMNAFARIWGSILPIRWYMQILFDQAVRGLPPSTSVGPFVALAALALGYGSIAGLQLIRISRSRRPNADESVAISGASGPMGMGSAFTAELRRILYDRGVFGMIVLAPVIYGALYPQPYLAEVLRHIPIAVVDQDNSELSRSLIQTLNADESVEVAYSGNTLAEAQQELDRREIFGILNIPAGTERDVLKGDQARLPAYVDAAYFLLYSHVLEGIEEAVGAVDAATASHGARLDGSLAHAALTRSSPVEVLSEPLFNPTGGYASYVVPAAFVLILQQTLLLGAATVGGVAFESGGRQNRLRRLGSRAVVAQALAHLCMAFPGLLLYLIVLPHVYGFSTLGRVGDLFAMAIPFVLSVSFLAQFVSIFFKRRETAVIFFIAVSLPLFFTVGVSWPVEAIPNSVRFVSRAFPSTFAIDGLVRINQMGASLHEVVDDWRGLWILTAAYALLAMAAAGLMLRRKGAHDA